MIFNRFRLYSVHLNPAVPRPYETAEFVPEGFNVAAFAFGWVWALYQRLWIPAGLLILLNIAVVESAERFGLSLSSIYVLQLGFQALVGFQANDVRRGVLARRGYIVADMVAAHTLLHAEQRFYDRYLPTMRESAQVTFSEA